MTYRRTVTLGETFPDSAASPVIISLRRHHDGALSRGLWACHAFSWCGSSSEVSYGIISEQAEFGGDNTEGLSPLVMVSLEEA